MIIKIPSHVFLLLETYCATAGGKEVSGLGTVHYEAGDFIVDNVWLLDVGSEVFTEIPSERIARLLKTPDLDHSALKLWWHRHPVGNGIPGQHNWSGTDEHTITKAPLGMTPELVKWSVSIVRTPLGWVGRVDHYVKSRISHVAVDQVLTPEEHESIVKLAASRGYVPQPTKTHRNWRQPTLIEKREVVDEVCSWFPGMRRGTRDLKGRAALKRALEECSVDYETYRDLKTMLKQGITPEVASAKLGVDLYTMKDLSLITWTELEDAYDRRLESMIDDRYEGDMA